MTLFLCYNSFRFFNFMKKEVMLNEGLKLNSAVIQNKKQERKLTIANGFRGKILAVLLIAVLFASVVAISPNEAKADTPSYPASDYISDVTPGGPPYLNYDVGGVRILLTNTGWQVGWFWEGAWALSYWVIESWEDQTGESWPYQWRSRWTVAYEIMYHCQVLGPITMWRVTTISFNDQSWD